MALKIKPKVNIFLFLKISDLSSFLLKMKQLGANDGGFLQHGAILSLP